MLAMGLEGLFVILLLALLFLLVFLLREWVMQNHPDEIPRPVLPPIRNGAVAFAQPLAVFDDEEEQIEGREAGAQEDHNVEQQEEVLDVVEEQEVQPQEA